MPTASLSLVRRRFEESAERTQALVRDFSYLLAAKVKAELLEEVPRGREWKTYRKSLRLGRVDGLTADRGAFVVYSKAVRRTVREKDAAEVALYVRPRRRAKVSEGVQVLARFSPWTIATLPFAPDAREAALVSRKVRKREVQRLTKLREHDRRYWEKELHRLRVPVADPKAMRRVFGKGVATLPDLAFEALRIELGLSGRKDKPHWRPVLKKVRGYVRGILLDKRLQKTWQDPSFEAWQKGLGSQVRGMSLRRAKGYAAFQRALRVRF